MNNWHYYCPKCKRKHYSARGKIFLKHYNIFRKANPLPTPFMGMYEPSQA